MGAVQSRKAGPARVEKESFLFFNKNILLNQIQFRFRANPLAASKGGYFILSFKSEKIKVVNADSAEISLLSQIIKRHGKIISEGWERHMTWAFHLGNNK